MTFLLWLKKRRKLLGKCGFYKALTNGNKKKANKLSKMTLKQLKKEAKA